MSRSFSSSFVAFLNSLMPSPRDLPKPDSFKPPNSSKSTTAMIAISLGAAETKELMEACLFSFRSTEKKKKKKKYVVLPSRVYPT